MRALTKAALVSVALATAMPLAATAQTAHPAGHHMMAPQPVLNLSAYGETRVAPDMATITTGVVTEAPTAAEAMRLNRERMTRVIETLRRAGIADKDIQTSGLNLSPQYTYQDNKPPVLRGYQVSNQVTVRVFDLTRIGAALDAVVESGANQVGGVSFGLRDPQAAEDAARREAVKKLRAKADLYAQATGKRIKDLVSLSEGGGYVPGPPMPMYARAEMAADAGSTPVAAGELSVRIDIQGVYSLE